MTVYEYLQEAIWDTSQVQVVLHEEGHGRIAAATISGTVIPFRDGHTVLLSGGTVAIPPPALPSGTFEQWYLEWNITTGEIGVVLKSAARHHEGWATLATGYHANGNAQVADQVVHITRHTFWEKLSQRPPHYGFYPNGQVIAIHIDGSRGREVLHPPLV